MPIASPFRLVIASPFRLVIASEAWQSHLMILSRSAAGVTRLLKSYGEQVKGEDNGYHFRVISDIIE